MSGTHRLRRYQRRRDAKLDAAKVEACWTLYDRGMSLRAIAAVVWERYGYASPHSASVALHDAFRLGGKPLRDRVAATRKASYRHGLKSRADPDTERYNELRRRRRVDRGETHGRICEALTKRGYPCRLHALDEARFCFAHDPSTDDLRRAILERARAGANARRPLAA